MELQIYIIVNIKWQVCTLTFTQGPLGSLLEAFRSGARDSFLIEISFSRKMKFIIAQLLWYE